MPPQINPPRWCLFYQLAQDHRTVLRNWNHDEWSSRSVLPRLTSERTNTRFDLIPTPISVVCFCIITEGIVTLKSSPQKPRDKVLPSQSYFDSAAKLPKTFIQFTQTISTPHKTAALQDFKRLVTLEILIPVPLSDLPYTRIDRHGPPLHIPHHHLLLVNLKSASRLPRHTQPLARKPRSGLATKKPRWKSLFLH
jgi:hypothetical protein